MSESNYNVHPYYPNVVIPKEELAIASCGMKIAVQNILPDWSKKSLKLYQKVSAIYLIFNTITNKVYVGQSKRLTCRWADERKELNKKKSKSPKLQNAWNKYGEDAFKFYVIEYCEKSDLIGKEIEWITKLDSFRNGYNTTPGGENPIQSPAAKAKIIANNKTPERRELSRETANAIWARPGAREERREQMKELWKDPKFIEIRKNFKRSEEGNKIHSEKLTKKWQDPEFRAKHKAAMLLYYASKKGADHSN